MVSSLPLFQAAQTKIPSAPELHGESLEHALHRQPAVWLQPRQRLFRPDWEMGSRPAQQVLTSPVAPGWSVGIWMPRFSETRWVWREVGGKQPAQYR